MNNTRKHTYALLAAAAATAGLGPACAQENGKVMIDVADCIKLDTPEARLACYESRVAAVFSDRAAQAAAVRPASPAPAASPAPTASASPPTTNAAAPAATPAPVRTVAIPASPPAATEPAQSRGDRVSRREEKAQAAEATTSDIVSRIKELREVLPDTWLVTLENGQVWRQTFSKHYELRPGYQVRVYSTRWGSASRLSADEVKGYIQVERVR